MTEGDKFKALVLRQKGGRTVHAIERLTIDDLPAGDVLVAVEYSSLNYKDGMAMTGIGKIVHQFPMVPGVDLAGTVLDSASPLYRPGDRVILTGWSVGERCWGGYTQKARVHSEWLVPLPQGMNTKRAMVVGTAGLAAMLCIMNLEEAGVEPGMGTVLVTGAAGGVGSIAVAVLAKLGYRVAALTSPSQQDTHDYLRALGATECISGPEWSEMPKPLESQQWNGAVDTIGGRVLARVLAQTVYGGCVANCGLVGGSDLTTTVMPFILRGVSLRGADTVMCPIPRRTTAWKRLTADLPEKALGILNPKAITLEELPEYAREIMAGRVRGRLVVDVNA